MEMRNLSQRDNESFSDFSNRTCSISNDCDWKDRDEQIVCSLIFGARHKEAQRKALLKPKDFSVKSCVEHFTSFEINDKQQNAIKSGAINVIDYKPKHKQQNCWFCGNIHPRKSCPAYGHECKKCGRTNHFERCCINKSGKEAKTSSQKSHQKSKGDREQYQTSKKQYGKNKNNKKVFHVNEHSDESSNEDLFCLEVNQHIDEPCELSYNQGTFSDELVYYLDTADQGDTNSKICDKDGIANSDIVDHSANNSYGNINIVSSSSLYGDDNLEVIDYDNNYTETIDTCVNDEDYSQCESESPDCVDDFTENDELNQCQNICAVFNESNDKYDKSFARLEFKDGRMGVLCKIDTGADISVMPERIFKKLYPKKSLDPCSTRLSAYNGTAITTIGQVDLIVTHANVNKLVRFIVTPTKSSTILSRRDAIDLKCVKFLCQDKCSHCNSDRPSISVINSFNIQHATKKWRKDLPLGKSGDAKEEIKSLFPDLFNGIGRLQNAYRIQLSPDAVPVRHAQRRVPESVKPKIKEELDRLVKEGIIKHVDTPTEWVNSIVCVTKPDGTVRLCLDPKDLNKYIKRQLHYTPTIDDILPDLHDSKFFSVIDAKSGYWNVPLENKSQLLTTFNTPGYGRYCFLRMPFGLISSQDIFQRCMDDLLEDLPKVNPIADDVKIHGCSEIEHDVLLLETLERCRRAGLNLNYAKCDIKKDSIKFFGNILSTAGMKPDVNKVKAIIDMKPPQNKGEVRSLIGMITFLNRYIPNASSLLEPLRSLIKKDIHFKWTEDHDKILRKVKETVASCHTLSYFDREKATMVQADASMKGLGACLMQEGNPVAFASKSLSSAELNYSNIEREMLGVVFALCRFHQYTYGRPVEVISDHKPLESINRKPLSEAPPRLQRMLLKIQQYNYKIIYQPGRTIPVPDCLSRLIDTSRQDPEVPGMHIKVHEIALTAESKISLIREQLKLDETLCNLRDFIVNGWPESKSEIPASLLCYWSFRDELGYYSGIIMKGTRILIPSSLVPDVLREIHRGHLGIEKCKLRARECVFWPTMNKDITDVVSKCDVCQTNALPQHNEYKLSMQQDSHYPLQYVGMDIFEYKQHNYLLIADYYSSYPWIRKLSNISTQKVVDACKSVFNEFGYPQQIHTDSGTQFLSCEFRAFLQDHNVTYSASSPYYHQSNGKAERFVQTIKQLLKKSDEQCSVAEAMLIYRSTPLSQNKMSPGELMFGRKLATNLVCAPTLSQKDKFDSDPPTSNPTSRFPTYYTNDLVFVYNTITKSWDKGRVIRNTEQPHQYEVMLSNGRTCLRNHCHLKPDKTAMTPVQTHPDPTPNEPVTKPVVPDPTDVTLAVPTATNIQPEAIPVQCRRSSRITRTPVYLKDFEH